MISDSQETSHSDTYSTSAWWIGQFFAVLSLTISLAACFQVGAGRLPKATADFHPAGTYTLPFDGMWTTIQDVLESDRINIAASNKNDGTITTDYVQGQTQVVALGFLGVQTTRYKYNIRLSRLEPARTKVSIIATLESSGNKAQEWHDVGSDNTQIVASIEHALYEKLERAIQRNHQ